jgi:hypothetical protein
MRTDLKEWYHPVLNPPDADGQDLKNIVTYLQANGLPTTAVPSVVTEVIDFPGGHYTNTNLVFALDGRPALSQPLYLAMNNPEAALALLGDYYGFTVPTPPPLFHPPAPAASAPATPKPAPKVLVGGKIMGNMYHGVAGDDSPAGTQYTDDRGTFKKVINPNPFGQEMHWEKIS